MEKQNTYGSWHNIEEKQGERTDATQLQDLLRATEIKTTGERTVTYVKMTEQRYIDLYKYSQ